MTSNFHKYFYMVYKSNLTHHHNTQNYMYKYQMIELYDMIIKDKLNILMLMLDQYKYYNNMDILNKLWNYYRSINRYMDMWHWLRYGKKEMGMWDRLLKRFNM